MEVLGRWIGREAWTKVCSTCLTLYIMLTGVKLTGQINKIPLDWHQSQEDEENLEEFVIWKSCFTQSKVILLSA